jgi:predicted transposase YbfD/YdcC
MSPGLPGATHFQGIQGLAGLVSTLEEANGEIAISRRLYLLSRKMAAAEALAAIRSHWGIENKLYWVFDVVFDEDHSRPGKIMLRSILSSCAAWSSRISSAQTAKKASFAAKSNTPAGPMASLQTSLPKCDSPVQQADIL